MKKFLTLALALFSTVAFGSGMYGYPATATFTDLTATQVDSQSTRATGANTTTTGAGVELQYTGGNAQVLGYDRTGAAYVPLYLRGSDVYLQTNGGTATVNGDQIATLAANNTFTGTNDFTGALTSNSKTVMVSQQSLYHADWSTAGTAVNLPTGWSSSKSATGIYSLTHNLGTTNYTATCTPYSASATQILYTSKSTNSFNVNTYTAAGASVDSNVGCVVIPW